MRTVLLACLALLACGPGPGVDPGRATGEGPGAPDGGAVLAVDGVPVGAAEVDVVADAIEGIDPAWVERHRRRLALTNVVLPRAALAAREPGRREEAEREARAALEALRAAGAPDGEVPEGLRERLETLERAGWNRLGLVVWAHLRGLESGTWSGPWEDVGRFVLARLVARERLAPGPAGEAYTVEILSFPYLPPGEGASAVDAAIDSSRLEVLDPAWGELVPEAWKHRMRGDR